MKKYEKLAIRKKKKFNIDIINFANTKKKIEKRMSNEEENLDRSMRNVFYSTLISLLCSIREKE